MHRTLIVANRTASTPLLLEEVGRRAAERPTEFMLFIPTVSSKRSPDWTLEAALKSLRQAVQGAGGARVESIVGGADAFESIKNAIAGGSYDDVIVSTVPRRLSKWLRQDLPRRVGRLGVPVTVITPEADDGRSTLGKFDGNSPPPQVFM